MPHAAFSEGIGRDQLVDDGLPRDDVAQDDQIVCEVDNVRRDPLAEIYWL
jgi:hypothetical protein